MKKILLSGLFTLCLLSTNAQAVYNSSGKKVAKKPAKEKGFNIDNLVVGGDFRFIAGSGFLSAGIAPMAGYKLIGQLYGGIKLGYSYDRLRIDPRNLPAGSSESVLSFNAYSPSIWARYLVWESIYFHAELEYNMFNSYVIETDPSSFTDRLVNKKIESPSVMLGVGFRQPISDRVSFNSTFLYDVLGRSDSYYQVMSNGGVDFRVGILIGL